MTVPTASALTPQASTWPAGHIASWARAALALSMPLSASTMPAVVWSGQASSGQLPMTVPTASALTPRKRYKGSLTSFCSSVSTPRAVGLIHGLTVGLLRLSYSLVISLLGPANGLIIGPSYSGQNIHNRATRGLSSLELSNPFGSGSQSPSLVIPLDTLAQTSLNLDFCQLAFCHLFVVTQTFLQK